MTFIMEKLAERFSTHLTNWGLAWFCLIFWGSIFNAIFLNLFNFSPEFYLNYLGYFVGFILGVFAKYKAWGWLG